MDPSKFHFHSFGTVAANKPRNNQDGSICDMAEIFPKETFTLAAGEITDSVDTIAVGGKDASGQDFKGDIKTKLSLSCKWLPIGDPNRITPPDIRRGEEVLIYRYADTQYYFWTNAFNNIIRKLETAVWWFSGTPEDGAKAETERNGENGYFVELSTHQKHIILSTSKKNGEVVRYYMQFNTADGNFVLSDDLGQEVLIDSVAGIMEVTTENEIIHNTKKYTINCDEYILNCKTSLVNAETSVTTKTKATVLESADTVSITTTDYSVSASSSVTYTTPTASFSGNVSVAKLLSFAGGMSGSGGGGATMQISGAAEFSGDVKSGGISLPGHHHTAQGASAPTTPAQS